MRKFSGEPIDGPQFFKLLTGNDEFCAELGRVILAANRLESTFKQYLEKHAPTEKTTKATLGRLINYAKKHELLSDLLIHLELVRDQRNYLTHKIYELLFGLIEETILERQNLLPADVSTYSERAWTLSNNLNALADIIDKEDTLAE